MLQQPEGHQSEPQSYRPRVRLGRLWLDPELRSLRRSNCVAAWRRVLNAV